MNHEQANRFLILTSSPETFRGIKRDPLKYKREEDTEVTLSLAMANKYEQMKSAIKKRIGTFEEAINKGLVRTEAEEREVVTIGVYTHHLKNILSYDNYLDYVEDCKLLGITPKEL